MRAEEPRWCFYLLRRGEERRGGGSGAVRGESEEHRGMVWTVLAARSSELGAAREQGTRSRRRRVEGAASFSSQGSGVGGARAASCATQLRITWRRAVQGGSRLWFCKKAPSKFFSITTKSLSCFFYLLLKPVAFWEFIWGI